MLVEHTVESPFIRLQQQEIEIGLFLFFHLRIMTVLMQQVCGREVPVCSDSVALVVGWGGGFTKYG